MTRMRRTRRKKARTRSPMPEGVSIGEGIFLRPDAEEADIIWEAVEAAGLEKNGEGVLDLLLLLLESGGESPLANPAFRYFKAHPEEFRALKEMGQQAATNLLHRFFRPK